MASDNETAEQFCEKVDHDWQPTEIGIRCANCGEIQELEFTVKGQSDGQNTTLSCHSQN